VKIEATSSERKFAARLVFTNPSILAIHLVIPFGTPIQENHRLREPPRTRAGCTLPQAMTQIVNSFALINNPTAPFSMKVRPCQLSIVENQALSV
jgi:hypothetical protein